MLVHKVNRAARNLYPVCEGLVLSLQPWEGRQQRWMNIEDAVGKRGNELRRQQPHVTCQANQIHAVRPQAGNQVGVVLGARAAFGNEDRGGQS